MKFKKSGKVIFGVELNAKEQAALDTEIQRMVHDGMPELLRRENRRIDATLLWNLHKQLGFGPDRLKKFYMNYSSDIYDLIKYYELSDIDEPWVCEKMISEYGIDLEAWEKEKENNNE